MLIETQLTVLFKQHQLFVKILPVFTYYCCIQKLLPCISSFQPNIFLTSQDQHPVYTSTRITCLAPNNFLPHWVENAKNAKKTYGI